MGIILGIDLGGSSCKIIGFNKQFIIGSLQLKTEDQTIALYGGIGKFLNIHNISLKCLEYIVVTGVGASFIKDDIYNIKTYKVDEFNAIGTGGLYLCEMDEGLVISMGTGTSFIKASKNSNIHLGGTGIGGGTLVGLSKLLFNIEDMDVINEMVNDGKLLNVDLTVGDISKDMVSFLPHDTTASNFGNISPYVKKEDIALSLVNMIFQNIGLLACFYLKNDKFSKNIILTGSLTYISKINHIFKKIENLHKVNFIIPDEAIFSTAIGAVKYFERKVSKK